MYQQITLVGNLGRDPEMRYTPSGVPVTTLSVATSRSWTAQDGQRQEKTIWFRVTAWDRQAEVASQYLTKGRQVLVVGEMEEPSTWTDNEGNCRASLEVRARTIKFIGGRGDTGGGYGDYSGGGQDESYSGGGSQSGGQDDGPNDIPF